MGGLFRFGICQMEFQSASNKVPQATAMEYIDVHGKVRKNYQNSAWTKTVNSFGLREKTVALLIYTG